MGGRRARRFVGLASLILLSGCVALTGLGDLAVDPELADASVGAGDGSSARGDGQVTGRDGTATNPGSDATFPGDDDSGDDSGPDQPDTGAIDTGPPDTGPVDAGPKDTGAPDTGAPDTGAPDTGAPDAGSTVGVKCGAKVCAGATPICCYYPIAAQGATCAVSPSACLDAPGYQCDGDEDCAGGKVCCVTWDDTEFFGSSTCQATCSSNGGGSGFSGQGLACTNAPNRCASADAGACKAAHDAPTPIAACQ